MRLRAIQFERLHRAPLLWALVLGLCLAVGASVAVRANVGTRPAAPVIALAAPEFNDMADTLPDPDDVGAMSHAERVALFTKRLAVFRLLHRTVLVSPRPGAGFVRHPIVHGTTEQECLTQAVYYEARGEPEEGQVAVAQVVVNRSHAGGRYPRSLCGVVFQGSSRPGCQFSFACEGDRQGGPVNRAAWDKASAVASKVIGGAAAGDLRATHYHTAAVAPLWDRSIAKLAQIGRHIFFGGHDPVPVPSPPPAIAAPTEPAPAPQG